MGTNAPEMHQKRKRKKTKLTMGKFFPVLIALGTLLAPRTRLASKASSSPYGRPAPIRYPAKPYSVPTLTPATRDGTDPVRLLSFQPMQFNALGKAGVGYIIYMYPVVPPAAQRRARSWAGSSDFYSRVQSVSWKCDLWGRKRTM